MSTTGQGGLRGKAHSSYRFMVVFCKAEVPPGPNASVGTSDGTITRRLCALSSRPPWPSSATRIAPTQIREKPLENERTITRYPLKTRKHLTGTCFFQVRKGSDPQTHGYGSHWRRIEVCREEAVAQNCHPG
jgi:hypothetical protein